MRGNAQSDLGFVGQLLGVLLSLSVLGPAILGVPLATRVHSSLHPNPLPREDPSFLQCLLPRVSGHFSKAGMRSSGHGCHIYWGLLSLSRTSAWSGVKGTAAAGLITVSAPMY